jgi:hypothetical protein
MDGMYHTGHKAEVLMQESSSPSSEKYSCMCLVLPAPLLGAGGFVMWGGRWIDLPLVGIDARRVVWVPDYKLWGPQERDMLNALKATVGLVEREMILDAVMYGSRESLSAVPALLFLAEHGTGLGFRATRAMVAIARYAPSEVARSVAASMRYAKGAHKHYCVAVLADIVTPTSREGIACLLHSLKDGPSGSRVTAAYGIHRMRYCDEALRPALTRSLRDDPSELVRFYCAGALGYYRGPKMEHVQAALAKAGDDTSPMVRDAARESLRALAEQVPAQAPPAQPAPNPPGRRS